MDSANILASLEKVVQSSPPINTYPCVGRVFGIDKYNNGLYSDGSRHCGERFTVWQGNNCATPDLRAETSLANYYIERGWQIGITLYFL